MIEFKEPYLERLKSEHHIDVWVSIESQPTADIICPWPGEHYDALRKKQRKNAENGKEPHALTFASRHFTVYKTDDYVNKFLKNRVKPHNLNAFPLPKEEAEALFGPVIAENFYAVRLSIRNDESDDKLISTGMIVASGRILVDPEDKGVPFTIPIEIAPHSMEQVYTILDDEEVRQRRPRVFRGLEFIGALATAVNAAFGTSADLTEGIGLFTGALIPGSKKLWPDRHPRYERNVVSFAMQDLMKVPKGSVINHKYIFFSKNKIEAILNDPSLFGWSTNWFRSWNKWLSAALSKQPTLPDAAIISVAFDNLDVPFEQVFAVEEKTFLENIADAQLNLKALLEQMDNIRDSWNPIKPDRLLTKMTGTDLNTATSAIQKAIDGLEKARTSDKSTLAEFVGRKKAAEKAVNDLIPVINSAHKMLSAILTSKSVSIPHGVDGISSLNLTKQWKTAADAIKVLADSEVENRKLTEESQKVLAGLTSPMTAHAASLNLAVDTFEKVLLPAVRAALPNLKTLRRLERQLRAAEATLTELKKAVGEQIANESKLPQQPVVDALNEVNMEIAKTLVPLQSTIDKISKPAEEAAAGNLPIHTENLESARIELVKTSKHLDRAKAALDRIARFSPSEKNKLDEEAQQAVERVKQNLDPEIKRFPGNLLKEAVDLNYNIIHRMPKTQETLRNLKLALDNGKNTLSNSQVALAGLKTKTADDPSYDRLIREIRTLKSVSAALDPNRIISDLINNGTYGIDRLRHYQEKITDLHKKYTRGGGTTGTDTQLKEMNNAIDNCRQAIAFYEQSAKTMVEASKTDPENVLRARLAGVATKAAYTGKEMETLTKQVIDKYMTPLLNTHKNIGLIPALNSK